MPVTQAGSLPDLCTSSLQSNISTAPTDLHTKDSTLGASHEADARNIALHGPKISVTCTRFSDKLRSPMGAANQSCDLNQAIVNASNSVSSMPFDWFVSLVDTMVERCYSTLELEMPQAHAKLLLLKLSNLLLLKYECVHKHTTLVSYPFSLIVDPANGCSLHCPACVHTSSDNARNFNWPAGFLTESLFWAFLDEYGPYGVDLYFANYGEPLLNKLTPRFIQMARRFGLPTYSSTSLSLKTINFEELVLSGLQLLILSIDGATSTTYVQYRRNGNFGLVIDNIRKLVAAKRRLNSYTPILHWQFLVFEHNVHEVEEVKQLAAALGVNQLSLVTPYDVAWDDPSILIKEDWPNEILFFDCNMDAYKAALDQMLVDLNDEVIDRHFRRKWWDRITSNRAPCHGAEGPPAGCHNWHSDHITRVTDVPIASEDENTRARVGRDGRKCCDWLYKNITMDATGRIMPCTRPPAIDANLVFADSFREGRFNSELHRLARQFFRNPVGYSTEVADKPSGELPFCSSCPHSNTVLDIDTQHVRQHLDNIGLYKGLSEEAKVALTDW
jgi:MoaA/NifB/PqqE/SkfB family radical SAM enzyme